MNVLIVATKAPWPPIDGGRLLLRTMLEGLAAAGHRAVLVAPVDPARFDLAAVTEALSGCCELRLVPAPPASLTTALLRAVRTGEPLSIARHALPAVRREVERSLREDRFDLLHAEQLQALPQAAPAFAAGLPVVLRAQNVESDLWRETAWRTGGARGVLLGIEARRLARWEGEAVRRAAATLTLTAEDAARLRDLALSGGEISVVRAPFPDLPAAAGEPLAGDPAIVVLGSQGWFPNEDAVAWFLAEVWPATLAILPAAVLHLFGAAPAGPLPARVNLHPAPRDSAEAFRPGSVLAVPLRIASGVRMKVLEAWSRDVPVVATPAALAGLEVVDGREALVAADAPAFAGALARLHREPGLAARLVEAGRRARRERHDPARVTAELIAAYERALVSSR
jgi:glycosyltransferase involved in cell wall biosynthesis